MEIPALVLINSTACPGEDRVPLAGPPLALLDVAGKSPFQRIVEQLEQAGISPITAVVEADSSSRPILTGMPSQVDCHLAAPEGFWRTGGNIFHSLAQRGAELVLVFRLGPYAEVDFRRFLQFHWERSCRASHVVHDQPAPEVFLVSASRPSDATALFCGDIDSCRRESPGFAHTGYVNALRDARDLRDFAVDILSLRTKTKPAGQQARPGIWIAPKARVDKGARILAPAFIGRSAHVRSGAVVTRCTAIEHHARVDSGTVVENSTVLPYSRIGSGLDVSHSVVGMEQIANLRLGTTVRVSLGSLTGYRPPLRQRVLWEARQILSLLYQRILRGMVRVRRALQPKPEDLVPQESLPGERTSLANRSAASSQTLSDRESSHT